MIKNRVVYILSIAIIIALILIYEDPITYLALYTALLLPFISLFISIITRQKFTISEALEKNEIVKGEETSYYVSIKNNSFLPCTSVNVKFFETPHIETLHREYIFPLGAKKKYDVSFNIEARHRGFFEIGIEGIILYDFIGLFSFKQKHKKRLQLTVLPRILEVNPISLKTATEGIEQNSNFKAEEDYSIVTDLRKYVPTDGYKKIHWKASAKKNELISKNFGTAKKNSVTLILDNTAAEIGEEDKILEAFVSVLNYAWGTGFDVSIAAMGMPQTSGNFEFLYKQISSIQFIKHKIDDNKNSSFATGSENFTIYLKDFIKMQIETDNLIIFTQNLTNELIAKAQFMKNNTLIYYTNKSTITEWANAKYTGEVINELT
ncbi:MAG: DUF58 domain-containing protein [Defluviitaleaceae bacterium]|nr:DUF58 domain-containing protein [Defluviitaleaceae bacterium]